eukprot:1825039-Amphidinium_carterae.1
MPPECRRSCRYLRGHLDQRRFVTGHLASGNCSSLSLDILRQRAGQRGKHVCHGMVFYGQLVVGPPGAGKTTYCNGMQQLITALKRPVSVVNLDPANEVLPYDCAIDIKDDTRAWHKSRAFTPRMLMFTA